MKKAPTKFEDGSIPGPLASTNLILTKPCLTKPFAFFTRGRSKRSAKPIRSERCRSFGTPRPENTSSSSRVSGEPCHETIPQNRSAIPSSRRYSTAKPERPSFCSTTNRKIALKSRSNFFKPQSPTYGTHYP